MYYTYILKSENSNKIYIGSTNDIDRRLKEHNSGKCFTTKKMTPVKVIYYEAYEYEEDARLR